MGVTYYPGVAGVAEARSLGPVTGTTWIWTINSFPNMGVPAYSPTLFTLDPDNFVALTGQMYVEPVGATTFYDTQIVTTFHVAMMPDSTLESACLELYTGGGSTLAQPVAACKIVRVVAGAGFGSMRIEPEFNGDAFRFSATPNATLTGGMKVRANGSIIGTAVELG